MGTLTFLFILCCSAALITVPVFSQMCVSHYYKWVLLYTNLLKSKLLFVPTILKTTSQSPLYCSAHLIRNSPSLGFVRSD